MLEKLGLRADVAANGREVLDMYAMLPYDIILMDCQMPELDGFETAREIRQREAPGSHVTIIALTAEAVAGCEERCLRAGMDDYISKPFSYDNLVKILNRWLQFGVADDTLASTQAGSRF